MNQACDCLLWGRAINAARFQLNSLVFNKLLCVRRLLSELFNACQSNNSLVVNIKVILICLLLNWVNAHCGLGIQLTSINLKRNYVHHRESMAVIEPYNVFQTEEAMD